MAQQFALTRRAMDEMAEDRAPALGVETEREIASPMQRVQGETFALLDRMLDGAKPPRGD